MKIAVLQSSGKQYLVKEGDSITLDKLVAEKSNVKLSEVLLVADGDTVKIGAPLVTGANVDTKILKTGKGKKVIVEKYKRKVRYHKKYGHRQPNSVLQVEKITL
jgi:large subunit ribosomal protein L21